MTLTIFLRYSTAFVLTFFGTQVSFTQTAVKGYVYDLNQGNPLGKVKILLDDVPVTESDHNGYFEIRASLKFN